MKTRNDFVSNSSSCSFIIHVQSQKDAEQLKSIYGKFSGKANLEKFFSFDDCWNGCLVRSADDIEKDSFVRVDVGEDHNLEVINEFYDVEGIIDSSEYKFKTYQDPGAHYTTGIEWRK